MPRGYRLAILALVGLLGAASPAPKQSAGEEQAERRAPIEKPAPAAVAAPPLKAVKAAPNKKPCADAQYGNGSDLCAQWEAANAARAAADWAGWQTWLGIAGTLGLFVTLYYTRRAVKIAVDASADADTALELAAKNAEAAVRLAEATERSTRLSNPFVWISAARFEDSPGAHFALVFTVENSGYQPATVTRIHFSLQWITGDLEIEMISLDTVECCWISAPRAPAAFPIRVKHRPARGNDSGVFVVVAEIVSVDLGGIEFKAPASFGTAQVDSFEAINSDTELLMMVEQLAPAERHEKRDDANHD